MLPTDEARLCLLSLGKWKRVYTQAGSLHPDKAGRDVGHLRQTSRSAYLLGTSNAGMKSSADINV